MSAHSALRAATHEAHDRIDSAFSALNLADRGDYCLFLQAHAAAFIPAEQALTDAGAARIIADWQQMLRSPALLCDLAAMGLSIPDPGGPIGYEGMAEVLGGAYVLEGSRLGGAMLRRQVPKEFPRLFLDSVQPPGRWRAFVTDLDRRLGDVAAVDRAIAAAARTFSLFERMGTGRDW